MRVGADTVWPALLNSTYSVYDINRDSIYLRCPF